MERLLGSHGPQAEYEEVDPDFIREVREIVARWPMHERRSGRDQGGETEGFGIEVRESPQANGKFHPQCTLAAARP